MAALTQAMRRPWIAIGVSILIQTAANNAYTFPLYSNSLKTELGFNQSNLAGLGIANNIGESIGFVAGVAINSRDPWIVVLIGALACFFGYGFIWLALTKILPLSFWVLFVASLVATNSNAWFTTAVLVTNMRNFPHSQGTVAGILKGYGALSAAFYSELYSVMGSSSPWLLGFLTIGVPIICLVIMRLVQPCTPATGNDPSENCHFLIIQASGVLLVVCVLITTILDYNKLLSTSWACSARLAMVLFLMAPLAIPIWITYYPSNRSESTSPEGDGHSISEPLIPPSEDGSTSEGANRPRRGEDLTFYAAWKRADFWLLFFAYFCGVGSGVAVLNNLAQIGLAQSMEDTKILLTFFSLGNFVGRLGGAAVSDLFVRLIPRTIWMVFTQGAMVFIYALFPLCFDHTLLWPTGFLGVCYGFQFSIMVLTASELFGLQNFGLIFNFLSLGNPMGAFLFSCLLVSYLYEKETRQGTETCMGPDCFRIAFYVLAGVCVVGCILSIVLTWRIKSIYKRLYPVASSGQNQTGE